MGEVVMALGVIIIGVRVRISIFFGVDLHLPFITKPPPLRHIGVPPAIQKANNFAHVGEYTGPESLLFG